MTDYHPGETISQIFQHHTAGLADGDFTKTLFKNNVISSITVTVTETSSSGFYKATFTTDSTDDALWELDIIETGDTTIRYQGTWVLRTVEYADVIKQNGKDNSLPNMVSQVLLRQDNQRLRFG